MKAMGPCPKSWAIPADYYRGVAHYFLENEGEHSAHLVRVDEQHPARFDRSARPSRSRSAIRAKSHPSAHADCEPTDRVGLTADYYKGDRSMRESGFDITFRFGALRRRNASLRARSA